MVELTVNKDALDVVEEALREYAEPSSWGTVVVDGVARSVFLPSGNPMQAARNALATLQDFVVYDKEEAVCPAQL